MKLITALLLTPASYGGPVPIYNPETATGGVHYATKPSKGQIPARAPVMQSFESLSGLEIVQLLLSALALYVLRRIAYRRR